MSLGISNWYSIRWYDEEGHEHYYGGTFKYDVLVKMLKTVFDKMPFAAYVKVFNDDSLVWVICKGDKINE